MGAENLPLLKGTLDLLVLKALSLEPMHGFGLTVWLEARSDGALEVEDSALYQALHRLEARRLVEARWGITENHRRAKYYSLTEAGHRHLEREAEQWDRYARTVNDLLGLERA
ncbi:MAG: PadR family transcriptional regulator [Gemmatimonadetes bacterium]|nr:PadR family transcriptional regulator [Gemmatimonadota bacterium]